MGMFEAIYTGAEAGAAKPPWDYGAARPQLVEWAEAQALAGGGREALVVGCGYGADAEFLASLGFRTTGFDFAPTAIAGARRKHPDTQVTYAGGIRKRLVYFHDPEENLLELCEYRQ